jgi:4-hydroxy-tetrahydrodipicolinate reductase
VDVVVDFTAPEAAVENMRAVLALGGRIVVGTTGWYAQLADMKALAIQRGGGLLYGTNFSIGVQKLFRLTAELAQLEGYKFSIDETHHTSKLDAPSGTALTLKEIILAVRTPRASTLFAPRATSTHWSCATTRTRGAALRWARCAARSGWRANPARGSSGRSSGSYKSPRSSSAHFGD